MIRYTNKAYNFDVIYKIIHIYINMYVYLHK